MADADLSRRLDRLESLVDPLPKIEARLHSQANTLQSHTMQLHAILGPTDSLLIQVGKMKGSIGLLDERLQRIDGGLDAIKNDVAKLVKSHELRKADVAGHWQLRATMAAAVIAALSAVAVAAMQMAP